MGCFSSRCSPRATGKQGRSKTVQLPEFSILLLFPQQNLLLWAQQLPLVRAKGKNMRWLTKCGHRFEAEDITFLYKKMPNPRFYISPCLSHTMPSATQDSPRQPWVPWDVATWLQFSPAEARNVPFPSAQPVPSLEHAASKYLKHKNLDLLCWLIFCQRRHNRKSVRHNEWMTRTAQEAAGSRFEGRPAVCCSLCSSTEQLVCCHYVTDTHQRSYCSADKVKAIPIPNDLCTLPSFLHPEPHQTACAGNDVKLGSKKHAPLQRGTGQKFTVPMI